MNKTVYFLIDCSGSMHGNRADAVNVAMRKIVDEAIPDIKAQKNADLNLTFLVLGFRDVGDNNKVFEIVSHTDLDDFNQWNPIPSEVFKGGTPTGSAIQTVVDDLQGSSFGDVDINRVAPVIILVSDGLPTDPDVYDKVLKYAVKGDPTEVLLFRKALRVALGMDVTEEGKASLERFGKLSKKMENAGIKAYYDCSEKYVESFVEILKSVTINASLD